MHKNRNSIFCFWLEICSSISYCVAVEKESKSFAVISTEDTAADLSFTIEAPSSYQDFAKIVHGRSDVDLNTVIQRIRISTNIALAEENKKKMQVRSSLDFIIVMHSGIIEVMRASYMLTLIKLAEYWAILGISFLQQDALYSGKVLKCMQMYPVLTGRITDWSLVTEFDIKMHMGACFQFFSSY